MASSRQYGNALLGVRHQEELLKRRGGEGLGGDGKAWDRRGGTGCEGMGKGRRTGKGRCAKGCELILNMTVSLAVLSENATGDDYKKLTIG